MNRLRLLFPYVVLVSVVAVVAASNLSGDGAETSAESAGADGRLVDVVCNMEVNTAWNIHARYGGKTYYFCSDACLNEFKGDPGRFIAARCVVCQKPLAGGPSCTATYLGKPYHLCSPEHRTRFKDDPAAFFMHSMWGIPSWLYYASIALVLIVSFGLFDWLGRRAAPARQPAPRLAGSIGMSSAVALPIARTAPASSAALRGCFKSRIRAATVRERGAFGGETRSLTVAALITSRLFKHPLSEPRGDRFDLLSIGLIRAALRSRVFRFSLQAFFVAAFLVIIAAGLFGNQNPAMNIAPILTWTVWWALLIVLILFAGKAWCYVCPWDALAGWTEKLSFWKKTNDGLSLGLRWPRIIRNVSLATILFVGLTWIELGFGVTMRPRVTAWLALAMLLMAVVSALLFDRKSFCRYGCLVGRVSGLYALFAGTEVRRRSAAVCDACRTKECVRGSDTAYGCPTFLYPGKLETNTYCIQCMECVQACPHDNLAVNLRPWGSDLAVEGRPRTDEAYLALLMLAITGFHGLTMTPVWKQFIDVVRGAMDVGRILGFSLAMAALMVAPIAVYAGLVAVSRYLGRDAVRGASLGRAGGRGALSYRDYFIRYAYALLPIALFYHIAHNLEHLLMEGPKVVAMVSDPFGWNWNLLGTAGWTVPPMISLDKLWLVQVFLVLVGHVYSLWVAQRTSRRLFGSTRAAFRSQLPMLFGMICFSVFSLWLLKQPMEMRTSAM